MKITMSRIREIIKKEINKKSDKIDKFEKQVAEGKAGLKKMVDTKQAQEFTDFRGKGTGKYFRTGTR